MKLFLSTVLFCLFGFLVSGGEVYLFQTTDLHGTLAGQDGLAGAPGVVAALSADAGTVGRNRALLIDCGDLLQGSREAALDHGASFVRLLNAADYDVWVPGNHDFEYGPDVLRARIGEFKGAFLAANLKFPKTEPYRIFERNGFRIAVIGMTNDNLSDWLFHPEQFGYHVTEIRTALDQQIPAVMKQKPDLIVLAVHSGLYPSKRLGDKGMFSVAFRYPQIAVIFGGHTHQKISGQRLGNTGVSYFQAGAHGGGYIKVCVQYDDETKKVKEISGRFYSVPRGTKVAEKFRIPSAKDNWKTACRNVPSFDGSKGRRLLAEHFALSIRKQFPQVKAVFHGALTTYRPRGGTLTNLDLFRLCPFENKVVLAELTAAELQKILEEQEKNKSYGMIQELFFAENFPGTGRGPVAFNSYAASGAGGRFPVLKQILENPAAKAKEIGWRVYDLFTAYMKETYP